jgi:hypothetical protein
LSWAKAILKSRAAKAVWETSTAPSKLNLPASKAGNAGAGWPASVTSVPTKVVSESAEAEAMPEIFAAAPSSLSVPLKPRRPPPACRARSAVWPLAPRAPTARSSLSGAPLIDASPASE